MSIGKSVGVALITLIALGLGGARAADFNGDGRADVMWRHATTGQNAVWLMNGPLLQSAGTIPSVPDMAWTIAGVGDFNGDGKSDILWRNTQAGSGQNAVWLMNGIGISSGGTINTVSDVAWLVAGLGDLNGDGKADIVWRHATSGQNAVWLMNGMSVASGGTITAVPDVAWQIVGVADFNGDGRADILWRNGSNGQNSIWLMNGNAVTSGGTIPTVSDLNWRIVAIADFDGDGRADILWRNGSSGQNSIWLMNGLTVIAGGTIMPVADTQWQVFGAGDFDGDGRADILWRNGTSGQNALWLMNGLATKSGGAILTVADTNWSVSLASALDGRPDPFSFAPATGATLNTPVTSDPMTVSGINALTTIRVSGGTYSVNGGGFTASPGTVKGGDVVRVLVTSSASPATTTCGSLDIGGVVAQFCVSTGSVDTTPNPFSFTPATGVQLNATVTSGSITVGGINAASPISISGGTYSINGLSYTSASGQVSNGNTVTVRVTASPNLNTTLCATLNIGGVTGQFCATTLASATVTLNPTANNCAVYNSLDSSVANKVFQNCFPAVGLNSYWNFEGGASLAFASLFKFNVSTLSGKTIDSANLVLEPRTLPAGYYRRGFKIGAVYSNSSWNPLTVTWNLMKNFSYYTSSWLSFGYPNSLYLEYNINLKAMVQAWANGTYVNNGIGLISTDYTSPGNVDSLDMYDFWVPTLTVTYH